MVGDVVATRRNERRLRTSVGEPVRNRERWTVTATDTVEEGDVTVTRLDGHGTITLPRDYVRQHLQLAVRDHRTRRTRRHLGTEPHPRHQRDDETRPVHGNDSRSTREPRPGGHQHPRPRRKHEPCSKPSCSPTAPTSPPRCSAATWQRPSPPACRSGGSGYRTGSTRFATRRKKVGGRTATARRTQHRARRCPRASCVGPSGAADGPGGTRAVRRAGRHRRTHREPSTVGTTPCRR